MWWLFACTSPVVPPPVVPPPAAPSDAIYLVMVDRFANGDAANDGTIDVADPQAFHGGDLKGVLERVDHLADLGVTTVWLTPIFAMRTDKFEGHGAFHGYWVKDPYALEPRFGTEADLAALRDALHARGMRLVLDLVWNHVSFDAPLRTERPGWFHPSLPITNWDDPVERETHEVHGLPDLAQEDPEVATWLVGAATRWAAYADGFRIDAVRHMSLDAQRSMGASVDAAAGRHLWRVGEVFEGDPTRLAASWEGGGFDAVFDFPLRYALIDVACKGAHPGRLASVLSSDRLYKDPSALVTFLDNHDTSRLITECGGDVAKAGRAIDLWLALRGTPSITWGTELPIAGAGEPDNRASYDWSAAETLEKTLRDGLARRKATPALATGTTRVVELTDDRLVLERALGGVAVNVTWSPAGVTVSDAVTGQGPSLAPAPVRFVVSGLPSGVEARVVGSAPELGAWDPARAPILLGDADRRVEVALPLGVVAWKVAVADGAGWRWADGPDSYAWMRAGNSEFTRAWP